MATDRARLPELGYRTVALTITGIQFLGRPERREAAGRGLDRNLWVLDYGYSAENWKVPLPISLTRGSPTPITDIDPAQRGPIGRPDQAARKAAAAIDRAGINPIAGR